jgi:hypothetical protein
MTAPPSLAALEGPLDDRSRRALQRTLSELLAWQRRLGRFPRGGPAPDATPIVSLYARGELYGCSASTEGDARERLLRAFLLALGDARFGGVGPGVRADLVARVAYPVRPRRVSLDAASRLIAPGVHGLALRTGDGFPTLLVPDVAREHELDAEGLLAAMEHKTGTDRRRWAPNGLFLFETEGVVTRPGGTPGEPPTDRMEAAVAWLAARVASDGRVSFGVDPRSGADELMGPMLHGRAAVVVQALAAHPRGRLARRRATRWLERALADGLSGKPVAGWPAEGPVVAGTLALAALAGLDVGAPLEQLARSDLLAASPWHAAQVACALGRRTPKRLWRGCVRGLDRDPRAPWVGLAAARRGDAAVLERVAAALTAGVRERGPHRGGVGSAVPELALTAITAEVLATARDVPARRAHDLARAFVERHQVLGDVWPEATRANRCIGGFPLTPVHTFQRCDVTAHAVLAVRSPSLVTDSHDEFGTAAKTA